MILLRPASLAEANKWIAAHHSHHKQVRGHKFSIAAENKSGELVGVVVVGRPVSAALDDKRTFEVTRLCTVGDRNAASRLLDAAWRAARAMGVTKMVSYTRVDENGTCYKAAGWVAVATTKPRTWNDGNKSLRWLPGLYAPTTEPIGRIRWEVSA